MAVRCFSIFGILPCGLCSLLPLPQNTLSLQRLTGVRVSDGVSGTTEIPLLILVSSFAATSNCRWRCGKALRYTRDKNLGKWYVVVLNAEKLWIPKIKPVKAPVIDVYNALSQAKCQNNSKRLISIMTVWKYQVLWNRSKTICHQTVPVDLSTNMIHFLFLCLVSLSAALLATWHWNAHILTLLHTKEMSICTLSALNMQQERPQWCFYQKRLLLRAKSLS